MGPPHRTAAAAAAAAAVAAVGASVAATAAAAAFDLTVGVSDLVLSTLDLSAAPNRQYAGALMEENCLRRDAGAAVTHEVLRFTTTISNVGREDLVIGLPPHDRSIVNANWEWGRSHMHWHYAAYAAYELIDETGRDAGVGFTPSTSAQTVNGQKTGFCVEDSTNCPGAKFQCCNMGITAGCADIYSNALTCQWIDVTGLDLTRRYKLKVTVNPGNRLGEENFSNNVAIVDVDFSRVARSGSYNLRAPAAMIYSNAFPVCKAWIDVDDALYPNAPINRVAFSLNPFEQLFNALFPDQAVPTTAATAPPTTALPPPAPVPAPAVPTRTECTFFFFCRQVPVGAVAPTAPPTAPPASTAPVPAPTTAVPAVPTRTECRFFFFCRDVPVVAPPPPTTVPVTAVPTTTSPAPTSTAAPTCRFFGFFCG